MLVKRTDEPPSRQASIYLEAYSPDVTYPTVEVDHESRIAQCGLPENKIGCLTAEAAAGHFHTIRGAGHETGTNLVRSILPGANCGSPSRGIRAVANPPGPTSLLETSCWRRPPTLILDCLGVSERADIIA